VNLNKGNWNGQIPRIGVIDLMECDRTNIWEKLKEGPKTDFEFPL
jgi:hypothetical protein